MEKKDERVLAYSMAKAIEHTDLAEISGGQHCCIRPTGGASGGKQGGEVHLDLVVDW